MKIAWYTPFAHHSAIGRFSHLVIKALRTTGVEVMLVRSEAKTPAVRAAQPICSEEKWTWSWDWERHLGQHAADYDLFVYNLGDHYENHCYCYHHQPHVPGLSILHDFSLHHALLQFCLSNRPHHGEYLDHLHAECGSEAVAAHDQTMRDHGAQRWWHQEIAHYPVYRWALQNTLGVVTHATFYQEAVAQRVGVPTTVLPLAYDSVWEPTDNQPAADPSLTGKLTILTVGAVNSNKRHQSVIHALGSSRFLRERCAYRIVGAIEPHQRQLLEQVIAAQPQRPDVVMTGQVTREELASELSAAHIISCLRYPALEGASASVVEGLLTGKPVLVSNTGCYQEIPPEYVHVIDPAHECSELVHRLEQLVRHYDHAREQSQIGRSWARERHDPARYAVGLVAFAERVLYDRPLVAIADRIAGHLQRWNAPAHDVFLHRVEGAMRDLFGRANSPASKRAA